jgi:DNA modification methylase
MTALLPLTPAYRSDCGSAYVVDALDGLAALPPASVDLIVTSPPFALLRQKSYGNEEQDRYVDWLLQFARAAQPTLKDTGSFVIDIGGAYQRGLPSRTLVQYRYLIRMVDELGYHLAEEFFWHNPSKLPSPIEWVNKRKIRAKDTVNTVWWFGKTPWPKADVRNVLAEYSDRMKKLLKDPEGFYSPKLRPSGHDISGRFGTDNGGAIPSNLLTFPNSESNGQYLRHCKQAGIPSHPARFPTKLPEFFIKFLTEPGDVVVDIFAGSNTTGQVAEGLGRRWLAFDLELEYVAASLFRFVEDDALALALYERVWAGESVVLPRAAQPALI